MSTYTLPQALADTGAILRRLPSVWGIWGRERLDAHLREEVLVAVAAAIGCRYCTFTHREIVLQSGEPLMALADFEQIDAPDERVYAAVIWSQAKVEAGFGPVPPAIERELRLRFDSRECRDIETVAMVIKLMSSVGHEADGLVQRFGRGSVSEGNLANQILMAALYFPPTFLVYAALAAKRGSLRTLLRDFREFSSTFGAARPKAETVPEGSRAAAQA